MKRSYHLDIHPRILELLGPNLYTNIYYVLAELIANAYDASAKNVYIIANKDDITVEDDGVGMSYSNGDVDKYLHVAQESRRSEEDSVTREGRRKMGRKGIGKLAALSISSEVWVKTICQKEKSGFVLTRNVPDGNELPALSDAQISFAHVTTHGTAIVMKNPQYKFPDSLETMKKNLLRIFPLVDDDFKIHLIRGSKEIVISDFDREIMKDLCCIVTLGKSFASLARLVTTPKDVKRVELVRSGDDVEIPIRMFDRNGKQHDYLLGVSGWLGAYESTKGRRAKMTDFPDNFISIFANKKMGEFNILPQVGQNKMNEVYVVGQLHVDLFEASELPDMALSNRQGYKTEDPRYQALLKYVRNDLLAEVLAKREKFTDYKNAEKKRLKEEESLRREQALKEQSRQQKEKTSAKFDQYTRRYGDTIPRAAAMAALDRAFVLGDRVIGLKQRVDSLKKTVLISHTYADKGLADIVFQMLRHNGVPAKDILYTNCDDEESRIPPDEAVYDYLRKFFVESLSDQRIYVLFVTSDNTKKSWGALMEIGASWITKVDHKIFNIAPFRPEKPLDDEHVWHQTDRDAEGNLSMSPLSADVCCQMIEYVCRQLAYRPKTRAENLRYLKGLVEIRSI